MDTSTVRLVIFLGMFLVFAGDYSALISSIFGNATERNITDTVGGPEARLKGPHDKISIVSKKDVDKDNGKDTGIEAPHEKCSVMRAYHVKREINYMT